MDIYLSNLNSTCLLGISPGTWPFDFEGEADPVGTSLSVITSLDRTGDSDAMGTGIFCLTGCSIKSGIQGEGLTMKSTRGLIEWLTDIFVCAPWCNFFLAAHCLQWRADFCTIWCRRNAFCKRFKMQHCKTLYKCNLIFIEIWYVTLVLIGSCLHFFSKILDVSLSPKWHFQ